MRKHMRKWLSLLLTLTLLMSMAGIASAEMANGIFEGSAQGMNGPVKVSVTVDSGIITQVNVLEHSETPGISDPAIDQIPAAIVTANSAEVDAVAGATMTSKGIMNAVKAALSGEISEAAAEVLVPFENIDVIVIGAGIAGLSASVRAAQLGANVLVFEQSPTIGGSGKFAGGSLVGVNTLQEAENGIEDSPELLMEDFVTLGGEGNNNPILARKFAETCGSAVDWLDTYVGVDFGTRKPTTGGYIALNVPRVHYAVPENGDVAMSSGKGGTGYIKALSAKLDEAKLTATVNAYNAACAGTAQDAFGRTDNMVSLAEGPFYAVKTIPYVMLTAGGPTMNENAQLLREDGSVIVGAYQCGEIVGSNNIAGHSSVGGMAHGNCVTWGMIAAESAVAHAMESK